MSPVKDSLDHDDQPDPAQQAVAADAYRTQVNPMVKLLQQLIEERPAGDDPFKNIAKVCSVIIQMGVEHKKMRGQRLQDQNYSPMLLEMMRDVDSIMEAYVENPPSGEGTGGETSSVGDKMRSVEDDAENDDATRKDLRP